MFHRRTRSLIPVKDLAKYEKLDVHVVEFEEEDVDTSMDQQAQDNTKAHRRQLLLIYLIVLAEAIMANSIRPEMSALLPESEQNKASANYLQAILVSAYYIGNAAGLLWGILSDWTGRRPIAIAGLFAMTLCCFGMGLAKNVVGCAVLRLVAGIVGSSAQVVALTMLSDVSTSDRQKVVNIARLPFVGLAAEVGTEVQTWVIEKVVGKERMESLPLLGGQVACGTMLLLIAVLVASMLKETHPSVAYPVQAEAQFDVLNEKSGFLHDYSDAKSETDSIASKPVALSHFLRAPCLLLLLTSTSLMAMHSSSTEAYLPELLHVMKPADDYPPSLAWATNMLFVALSAGLTMHYLPILCFRQQPRRNTRSASEILSNKNVQRLYRILALSFLVMYLTFPIPVTLSGSWSLPIWVIIGHLRHFLTSPAWALTALLTISASPSDSTTGTVTGLVSSTRIFRALGGVAAAAGYFFLSQGESSSELMYRAYYVIWGVIVLVAVGGAVVAWFVRVGVRLGEDFEGETLGWVGLWDADEESGLGVVKEEDDDAAEVEEGWIEQRLGG